MAPLNRSDTSSMDVSIAVFDVKRDIGRKNANFSYSHNLHNHLKSFRISS